VSEGKTVDAQGPRGKRNQKGKGKSCGKKRRADRRMESWGEIEIAGFRRNAGLVRRDQSAEIRDTGRVPPHQDK